MKGGRGSRKKGRREGGTGVGRGEGRRKRKGGEREGREESKVKEGEQEEREEKKVKEGKDEQPWNHRSLLDSSLLKITYLLLGNSP